MNALFLICALSMPAASFTRPAIVSWFAAKSEEDRLRDFIHRNDPDAEIFITPKGDAKTLWEYGYERVPFTWRDKEIWIQRKPKHDQKCLEAA